MCVNAASGIWLPLANTCEDGAGAPPNTALDALLVDPDSAVGLAATAPAATDALDGPSPAVAVDPPVVIPPPTLTPGAADRMNRLLKSAGRASNPGCTSST